MINRLLQQPRKKIPIPEEYKELIGKKLLVTGAASCIGGALFRRLDAYGLDVIGTVLYPEEERVLREKGYQVKILDLASEDSWDHILEGIDIVFNIAALFQEVENDESMYDKVNHIGTLKLIETANRVGVNRFVHCSTVGVHGHVKEIPCTEETPFNPMDEYHRTKLQGELAVLDYAKRLPLDGMIVTVNRPAMVYGPGDTRMLKLFKAVDMGKFMMIGSGKVFAHLGYMEDQVDSFLLCAVKPREVVHLNAFNIASGRYITLNELVQYISEATGKKIPNIHIPVGPVWLLGFLCEILCKPFGIKPPIFRRRVGFFTHDRAFDLTKAKKFLNYEPKWEAKEGIQETVSWYKKEGFL